ncbi:MAG: trypsin-like peptidase domain-containing protein [Planctomycetes bacterium]|nr:trypsin-like peptidase domain-containing protein [Planctomycetota bacterium]
MRNARFSNPVRLSAALLACLVPFTTARATTSQDDALTKLRAFEDARRQLIARLEPSVCAVMSLKRQGGGSGVIFHPRGWILTNFHVTTTEKVLKIGLPDGEFHLADVIGIDPGGDIAVCALRGEGPLEGGLWPAARLGSSSKLQVGGVVYAMGNPFLLATDFKPTVTVGVVSGIHRYQGGTGPNGRNLSYPDCIQVDAAVNPGNSGGPLFDENGLLVGINGRITIRDRGRVNTGVGFAVSIDQIRNFLPSLLAGRHTEHGTLSINAWHMKDPNRGTGEEAIFVQGMIDDCEAYKLGLRQGDKLLRFDGRDILWVNDLARWQGVLPAGFEVALQYQPWQPDERRYGQVQTLSMQLTPFDTGSSRDPAPNVPDWSDRPDFDRLAKEMAELEERKKSIPKLPQDLAELPEELRKLLPEKSDAKRVDDLDSKLQKKLEARWKALELAKLPKERDVERERALFGYMDGVVAELRTRLERSLGNVARERELMVLVTPAKEDDKAGGGASEADTATVEGENVVVIVQGDRLEQRAGSVVKASDSEVEDVATSMSRRLLLDPLLDPRRVLSALDDAYVEDGIAIGGRIAYVLALRGPGKRAVFVDAEFGFPLGCRYRDPDIGSLIEIRITEFARDGDRVTPTRAEVRAGLRVRETWKIDQGAPSFLAMTEAVPVPSDTVAKRLEPLMHSVVKVFGKSGFAKIEAYGSGLVVSAEGDVLTWSHANLLDGNARVVFPDGSVHDYMRQIEHPDLGATMLRPRLPIPKLHLDSVRSLTFPSTRTELEPGTPVFSISNMFKLAEFAEPLSVTFGVVVSSLRSDLRLNLRRFPFQGEVLIVDAPSGPGSHGGGLFGLDGQLYGMLTPISESAETNTQLHMAIPAHELAAFVALGTGKKREAREIAAEINKDVDKPPVEHGIQLFEAGRDRSPPAYVDRIRRNSPASRAKLRPDDLIVRVNDFPIRTCAEFHRAIRTFAPGDKIDLTFKRGATVMKVTLELEAKQ